MNGASRLSSVTVDCPDARHLAQFYADITGGRVTHRGEQWASVQGPGGRIDFQTVPGYTPRGEPQPVLPCDPRPDVSFKADVVGARRCRSARFR
jgi:hypothetical protein